jgi:hypothetical protein
VTQALTEAGFIDGRWFTDDAAERGAAVHETVHQFYAGSSRTDTDPEIVPFVAAFALFLQQCPMAVEASEERVFDPLTGYAGTLDLRGRLGEQKAGTDLIDIKTGHVPGWVGYQTAAYARLVETRPVRRWALNLRADGTYRLLPLVKRTDEKVFLAALTVAQAKRGWL